MRSFFVLVFGMIVGAAGALTAANMSPTREIVAPYIEQIFTADAPTPLLLADEVLLSEEVFTASQLAPFAIEPCFPREAAVSVSEKPWLERDLASSALEGTQLDTFPDLADYPGLIKIEGIRSTAGSQREHCAAVRIAQHWFLTAAHCIIDLDIATAKPTYDVIAVTPDVDVRREGIRVQSLRGAVCHSAYGMNRQQYPNDIALFYLEDVSAFEDVMIAPLETMDARLLPRDLNSVYIAGWGRNGGTQYLQGGPVRITEPGEAVLVADKIGRRGPNVGDSGAPLYASTPDGPLVIGILSQVTQDRDQNGDRSIYVRSMAMHEWIMQTMAICEQNGVYLCSASVPS
ncbi:MAG: S1 family peptidase [Pseudomonadota bacterium]